MPERFYTRGTVSTWGHEQRGKCQFNTICGVTEDRDAVSLDSDLPTEFTSRRRAKERISKDSKYLYVT